jgi:transposase-like protein
MDTSEYARFERPGHRVTGDRSSQDRQHRDGVDYVHAIVDDHPNAVVRKAVRVRGHFPDDESARKLVYLAIRNHETTWKRPMAGWYECLAAFHAHFQDRLTRQS